MSEQQPRDAEAPLTDASTPSAAATHGGRTSGSDNWVSRLVELDELEDSAPSRATAKPAAPPKETTPDPPPTEPLPPRSARLPPLMKVLVALLSLQTGTFLGYLAFRPAASPAVFRLEAGQTLSTANLAHSPADEATLVSEVVVAAAGGQFTSIAQAIEASPDGTRILIKPGTYREQLVLDKAIEVVGDGPREEIIVEMSGGTLLTMKSDGAIVRGLTLVLAEGVDNDSNHTITVERGDSVLEDCDITSKQENCILVRGATSRPRIVNCRIHDCAGIGMDFRDGAAGEITDCVFTSTTRIATLLMENANPSFENCEWSDNSGNAIIVKGSRGRFEDCNLSGHESITVAVQDGSDPAFDNCRFGNNPGMALKIDSQSAGLYDNCQFVSNRINIRVSGESTPTLRDCTTTDSQDVALKIEGQSKGLYERCKFSGQGSSCVLVDSGSSPRMIGCTIEGGTNSVMVENQSSGLFEDCSISKGTIGVYVWTDANPIFSGCRIRIERTTVWARGNAQGLFEDCEITSNQRTAVELNGTSHTQFRGSRLQGKLKALSISESAHGLLDDCDLAGSDENAVLVDSEGRVSLTNCRIADCQGVAIHLETRGRCALANCDVSKCGSALFVGATCPVDVQRCEFHHNKEINVRLAGQSSARFSDCQLHDAEGQNLLIEEESAPVLVSCKISSAGTNGVLVRNKANPAFIDCQLFGNNQYNLAATDHSSLGLVRCEIYEAEGSGLIVGRDARANIEDCEFRGNKGPGIQAADRAYLRIEGGSISKNHREGINIEAATAVLTNCELSANQAQAALISNEGGLTLDGCRFFKAGMDAAHVSLKSTLRAHNCTFDGSQGNLVTLGSNAYAVFRDCSLSQAEKSGLSTDASFAELLKCTFSNNKVHGVSSNGGSRLTAVDCKFENNARSGLAFHEQCRGTIEGGSIETNGESGVYAQKNTTLSLYGVPLTGNAVAVELGESGVASLFNCVATDSKQTDWKANANAKLDGSNNTPPLNSSKPGGQ